MKPEILRRKQLTKNQRQRASSLSGLPPHLQVPVETLEEHVILPALMKDLQKASKEKTREIG